MARLDSSQDSSQARELGVPDVSDWSVGWGSSTHRWCGGGDEGTYGLGKGDHHCG